jgi:hypothetical protein
MGMARQTPTTATSRLVCKLEAKRQDEGEDTLNKRLAVKPRHHFVYASAE